VLFLLDEAGRPMAGSKPWETARDIGRKYGRLVHMLVHSVAI